jgi:arylsulfatase A-like enzyme
MPTLLGLCGVPIPDSCEGLDFSRHIAGDADPSDGSALVMSLQPFGQWTAARHGGKEYRGLRTQRHTYVADRKGPWLLYDNETDPYQLRNLVHDATFSAIRTTLDECLRRKLDRCGDEFLPGSDYLDKWGYRVDETGTVPYTG